MAKGMFRGGGGRRGSMMGPAAKAKNSKETILRIGTYLTTKKISLAIVFLMVIASSVLALTGPYLIGVAIDNYIVPGDFPGLLNISITLASIYIGSAFFTWAQNYIMIGVSQAIVFQMRRDLFEKLHSLPLGYFDSKPHGEIMSRVTNDMDNLSSTLNNSTTQVFSSFITIVGTLAMMIWLSPILTILSLLIIPLVLVATRLIAEKTREYFSHNQKTLGELNGLIEETISGQKVIKAFGHEEKVIEDFSIKNNRLREVGIKAQVYSGVIFPLMHVFNNISFAIVAGAGGWLAVQGAITVGVIVSFINYSRQFTRPLNELANQFNMIQSAIAGAERVFEILDQEREREDPKDVKVLDEVKGEVVFNQVSFGYEKDIPVLKAISLDAQPGQTIALVGPTGAGKTTIINLLTGFYDVHQGRITIDGHDIREISRENLRSLLGIVLQDTYLFSETIRENIRYGRLDATDTEVERAAQLAYAHPFIQRLPDGYDTVLSEDGGNLSHGERQLIAMARTILKDPAILILDEATSSIDTRTEAQIQGALLNLMAGRTSFVIAHRLSTIVNADRILVINGGQVIEAGNHQELLAKKGFYHNLYMNQFDRLIS